MMEKIHPFGLTQFIGMKMLITQITLQAGKQQNQTTQRKHRQFILGTALAGHRRESGCQVIGLLQETVES